MTDIPGDNRSAIWGGGTLGLVVGLLIAFFTEFYWRTVLNAVLIGAGIGFIFEVGNRLTRRR